MHTAWRKQTVALYWACIKKMYTLIIVLEHLVFDQWKQRYVSHTDNIEMTCSLWCHVPFSDSKVWTLMNDEENYNEWRIPGDAENKWCLKQEKILAKRTLGFHEQPDKIVPAATQTSFKDTIETVMNGERLSELRFPLPNYYLSGHLY